MMKQQWEKLNAKLEAMTVRERVLVFATLAVVLLSLLNMLLLEPLLVRQKALRIQLSQQQQMISDVQSQIAAIQQENSPGSTSPERNQINQLRQEIADSNAYLQSSRERLVQPENMAEHMRKLLNKNKELQIISLRTLPVTPLIEQAGSEQAVATAVMDKQVFKHGVQLTLRGSYLDLLQYVSALEKLPQQMYWAKAEMKVVQYPATELTLILYTLSLDQTWLQI